MIYEDILPHYLAIGVSKAEFMDSNPYELKPYDKAYMMKRKITDENNWYLGQYIMSAFGTVLSSAFSKNSKAKYIEKPFLSQLNTSNEDVGENNEIIAAAEFMKFAEEMRRQGLPETEIDL